MRLPQLLQLVAALLLLTFGLYACVDIAQAQPRPEGIINYADGTPIAETDGDPVSCISVNPRSQERYKYRCLVHLPSGRTSWGFYDADGNRQGGGTKLRNVPQQPRYRIMGIADPWYIKTEALRQAASRKAVTGEETPVVEIMVGDKGKVIRSTVLPQ